MELLAIAAIGLLLAPVVLAIVSLATTRRLKQEVASLRTIVHRLRKEVSDVRADYKTAPEIQVDDSVSDSIPTKEPGPSSRKSDPESIEAIEDKPAPEEPGPLEARGSGYPKVDVPQLTRPATQQKPAPPSQSMEEKVGTKWSVWTGGVALALGGVFLVRYSIEQGLVTPAVRVAMATVLAISLATVGEFARRRENLSAIAGVRGAHIPGIFTAAAIVTALATTFVAYAFFGFLGPLSAFILLGLVSLTALAGSSLHGPMLAALGLVGSYATPALVASDHPNAVTLFVYLAFVTAATYVTARLRSWLWLAVCGTAGAVSWGFVWYATAWQNSDVVPMSGYILVLLALAGIILKGDEPDESAKADAWRQTDKPLVIMLAAISLHAFVLLRMSDYDTVSIVVFAMTTAGFVGAAWRWPSLLFLAPVAAILFTGAYLTWHLPGIIEHTRLDFVKQRLNLFPIAPPQTQVFLTFGAGFSVFFATAGFAALKARKKHFLWAAVSALTPVIALAYAYYQATGFQHSIPFGLASIGLAAAATVAGDRFDRDLTARHRDLVVGIYAVAAVAALALCFTILLERGWLTVALALTTPGLAWISVRRDITVLRYVTTVVVAVVIARTILDPAVMGSDVGDTPIFNWLLYGYGVPALAFTGAAYLYRSVKDDLHSGALEAAAILFSVLLVTLQIRHLLNDGDIFGIDLELAELSLHTMTMLGLSLGYQILHDKTGRRIPGHAAAILSLAGLVLLIAGHLGIANPLLTNKPIGDNVYFNLLLLGYALPGLMCAFIVRFAAGKRPDYYVYAFAGTALLMIFAFLSLEVRTVFQGSTLASGPVTDLESYTYSAVWLVFGLALLIAGVFFGRAPLRYASLPVIVLTVAKVFLVDMSNLTGILRALSFIGLGLVLMAIGFLYQKLVFPQLRTPDAQDTDTARAPE